MHEKCRGCGTEGKGVEMQGIYCCPNKYCLASGAWGHRIKAGYQDEEGRVSDTQLQKMLVDLRKEASELRVRLEVLERCEKRLMRYQEEEANHDVRISRTDDRRTSRGRRPSETKALS